MLTPALFHDPFARFFCKHDLLVFNVDTRHCELTVAVFHVPTARFHCKHDLLVLEWMQTY